MQLTHVDTSANDGAYSRPRARNAPIKASFTSVDGLPPKLKLYRIAGSRYWQMRLYNLGRYTIQSLKTTDREEAKLFARQIFKPWRTRAPTSLKTSPSKWSKRAISNSCMT